MWEADISESVQQCGEASASRVRSKNLSHGQNRFAKITKYRNSSSANPLRILLTACSAAQCASNRSVCGDCLSSVGVVNNLLVGRMTISVNGITEPMRIPPTSHQYVPPASHAAMEESSPTAASVACMTVALR